MRSRTRGHFVLLVLFVCASADCGKKGPPLAPLARVPQAPAEAQAIRVGDEVFISFGVPAANVSGQTPADVDAIEVYAFTGAAPPPGPDPIRQAVKIGTYPVHPPIVPPPSEPGAESPAPIVPPGFVQGARAVVRETLTPEVLAPTPLTATPGRPAADSPAEPPVTAVALSAPLKRYYVAVARGSRGPASAPSAAVWIPVQEASAPPPQLAVEYTDQTTTLKWSPSADAQVAPPTPDPTLLPSKPLQPLAPPTRYLVFEVPDGEAPPANQFSLAVPSPVAPEPVAGTELVIKAPVRYGERRCFVVRAADTIAGAVALGRASDPACVTPVDTFPPAPPQRLAAIAGVGVINLIWEPNAESDLAGYIVLRGAAPGDNLQALTPTPVRETTYRDQAVRPGERYVYAVVAVDNANPQNVSGQSNRVEESSRAPR